MLTDRIDEIDQFIGLELGADECIHKPFSPRMVVAHTRALLVLHRGQPNQLISVYQKIGRRDLVCLYTGRGRKKRPQPNAILKILLLLLDFFRNLL